MLLYDLFMNNQSLAIDEFRRLHESGCFVLPNPWDAGTAIFLEQLGFKALASTSAGFAFSKGLPDGPDAVSRDVMLDHFRELAKATSCLLMPTIRTAMPINLKTWLRMSSFAFEQAWPGLSIEDSTGRSDSRFTISLAQSNV